MSKYRGGQKSVSSITAFNLFSYITGISPTFIAGVEDRALGRVPDRGQLHDSRQEELPPPLTARPRVRVPLQGGQ